MSLSDIQYIVTSTSSLSYGSFLNQEDLKFYTNNLISRNIPFGRFEEDYIRFGVYNLDNSFITSSTIYSKGEYSYHTSSFYDVFNQFTTYSYKKYNTDYVILGTETQSLFFDVSRNLNNLSIQNGNYKIYIELGREVVGSERNTDNRLTVSAISTSATEIGLTPKSLRTDRTKLNSDFEVFCNSQVRINEIADDLIFGLSKPEIYRIYTEVSRQNPSGSNELKFNYSFKTEADVVSFLNDIYYGVKKGNLRSNGQYANNDVLGIYDQFKNWLYQNYEVGYTFSFIRDYYYSLFLYIVDQELNRITNKKPDTYPQIVEFLQTIFYNNIFFPTSFVLEGNYNINISGYFKYYLNIPGKSPIPIINRKFIPSTDPNFHNLLAIKLLNPLPEDVDVNTDAWITCDFAFLPIVQNIYYYTRQAINTVKLRGPNFLIKIENEGNSTEALSMEQLIGETGNLYDELNSKLEGKSQRFIDTTDYRNFKNFINFSSADLRVKAFENKRNKIEQLEEEIKELDIKLTANPNDTFYLRQRTEANEEIDAIEAGMDGYEKFLYDNPMWYDEHTTDVNGYTSASFYDSENGGSLINNLPQFMVEDADNNAEYIKFVGMVGHFFDNISLAAKQYTEKNNISSSPNVGISTDIVGDMLQSLGWDVEISKDNLPLILSAFSKSDFDPESPLYSKAREFSEEQRNQIIWKRILNTLPYIYKTKGTEASLNALISCFGVPKNIIKIKEYGGIQNVSDLTDKSLYIVEEVKYEPYFSGSGEYFKLDWTGSAQSIEFSFRFDTKKTHEDGVVFRLLNCSDVWVMGAVRERGKDWGKLFFSVDDGAGSIKSIITSRAPIFDGNSYRAMIRRNDVQPLFGATASFNLYPTKYELLLQKSEDDRITFYVSASAFLSGSYNDSFESGSYLYIGNYNQNTASLSIDPEAFFGNIDDIRIWESPLSTEIFTAHTLNRNAYDLETPQQMVSENLYRISFERPVDLYDPVPSGVLLNNLSFRDDFPTFAAINFPEVLGPLEQITSCDPVEGPAFPYQFSRKDVRMTMNLPDYGSNKFRSNKINYIEQQLATNLSPETRASYKASELSNVDSNKLGIFFSSSELQNAEIIKFFGEYPLGDLIGDPADVYKSSYDKFEKFKKIYYDQGFGNIDFSFFMNIVRFYFDKAMFKYIRGLIPARAKLVDGILIEPTILERPKLKSKPLVKENIQQKVGGAYAKNNITAIQDANKSASLDFKYRGSAIYSDINQVFFPAVEDTYGFSLFAEDGVTFFNNEFYRVDTVKYTKKYQVYEEYVKPYAALSQSQVVNDFRGKTNTIEKSYYKVNIARLPLLTEYPMTASFNVGILGEIYFSGSLFFNEGLVGTFNCTTTQSHGISGIISGAFEGLDTDQSSNFLIGNISSPGISITGSLIDNGRVVTYAGDFDVRNGVQTFEGNIYGENVGNGVNDKSVYSITFISSHPTRSIFREFSETTSDVLFGPLGQGVSYRKAYSMQYYPPNSTLLTGYRDNHYKYTKRQFSTKEWNSYQIDPVNSSETSFKWKKHSQNKKTTVDPETGLLDNSEPVISKTV
jgi:hypothetical protein